MPTIAIIVAAGSGSRFGSDKPKQFVELLGKPLIIHTLERFDACPAVDEIVATYDGAGSCPSCNDVRCPEHRWWLTDAEEDQLAERHKEHEVHDPWRDVVEAYVATRAELTISEVLSKSLRVEEKDQTQVYSKKVAAILRKLGFVEREIKVSGRRARGWGRT